MDERIMKNVTYGVAKGCKERIASGGDLLSLGLGQPDYPVPEEVIEGTIEALRNGHWGYVPSLGIPELRRAISDYYMKRYEALYDKNNILVTPGVRQGIILSLMTILEPADEVIIFTPYFSSYPAMVKLGQSGAVIVEYEMSPEEKGLDFQRLEALITEKTRAIICNFPHNPTGAILHKGDCQAMVELIQKHDLYVISDEVYERNTYEGNCQMLSACEALRDQMFVVNGYSKMFAMTGWRLGYVLFPERFRQTMAKLSLHMNACANAFVQHGAVKLYEVADTYIDQHNNHMKRNRDQLITFLEERGLTYFYPYSGYFCFVNMKVSGLKSNDFCYKLASEQGVAVTPGYACGERWDDYVRISFAVNEGVFEKALKRLDRMLSN